MPQGTHREDGMLLSNLHLCQQEEGQSNWVQGQQNAICKFSTFRPKAEPGGKELRWSKQNIRKHRHSGLCSGSLLMQMSASNLMLGKLQGRAHTRSQPSPAAALAEHPGTLLCFAVPGGLGNAATLGNRGDSLSTVQTNLGHLTSQGVEPPCAWSRASVWPSPSWFTAWMCLAPEGSRSAFRQWRPRAAQPDLGALSKAPATLPQILTWWNRDTSTLWGSTETKPKPFSCEIILLICCFFSLSVLPTSSHTPSTTSSSVASASCKSYPGSPISFTLCKSQLSEMSVGRWGLESGKRGYNQTTRKIHLAVHKRQ